MGKHVDRIGMQIQKKALALKLAPSSSLSASSLSGCPFGGVFDPKIEVEDRSVYELLMIDNRVEKELADNLVMALFRTGIDSVSTFLWQCCLTISFTLSPLFSTSVHRLATVWLSFCTIWPAIQTSKKNFTKRFVKFYPMASLPAQVPSRKCHTWRPVFENHSGETVLHCNYLHTCAAAWDLWPRKLCYYTSGSISLNYSW